MTTASFFQQGNCFEVSIRGHAGYNPGGPDVVCAACSALACTLLQCLLEEEDRGSLRDFRQESSGGDVYARFTAQPAARERVETVVSVIISGMALLEQEYPEHVRLCISSGEGHKVCLPRAFI